jgi:hypothetical protein
LYNHGDSGPEEYLTPAEWRERERQERMEGRTISRPPKPGPVGRGEICREIRDFRKAHPIVSTLQRIFGREDPYMGGGQG